MTTTDAIPRQERGVPEPYRHAARIAFAILAAVAVFMYVSILYKIINFGP
jgi:hypothetical protein